MNLKKLSDDTLLDQTEKLARQEREILVSVLHHLREIERRRLYSALKYSSLYEYSTKRLGYSEDQAYRRISAMKLLKELPELEEKLDSGNLTLTHLGVAQSLFKKEQKISQMSREQKLEILKKFENTSCREAEKIAVSLSSQPAKLNPDRIKPVSPTDIEITFTAPAEIENKIKELKDFWARSHPDMSIGELFNKLCDLGLCEKHKSAAPRKAAHKSRANLIRLVRQRANQKCENCGGAFALEIDHIKPRAYGGKDSFDNLRLLCRSCNQRAAIEKLGLSKMEPYLERE